MSLYQDRHLLSHPYPAQQHHLPAALDCARHALPSPLEPDLGTVDIDFDLDVDLDLDHDASIHYSNSQSSSPRSTQSLLSHGSAAAFSPLSTFASIPPPPPPPPPAPKPAHEAALFDLPSQSGPGHGFASSPARLCADAALMQTETWMPNGQLTPRSVGSGPVSSHNRDSSRSSLGSNGPASPFSHNISNPHVALNDSMADGFHGLSGAEDLNYQLAAKSFPGVTHDNFYTALPGYGGPADAGQSQTAISGIPSYAAAPRRGNERGLLPPSQHPIGPNRSQPVSVASSIASDSPATPAGEPEGDRRLHSSSSSNSNNNNTAMHTVPKLDRTMTDVYNDELYNPNFTITSSSSGQVPISPSSSDLFSQRLQAANSQHLSAATQSPVSAASRDQSPFRKGSPLAPLAPLPLRDFQSTMGSQQMRFGSAQQMREQHKALQDAHALQQQIARSTDTSTPQTISPKDAMLEFHEPEGDANFPLFPQQSANGFGAGAGAVSKAAAPQTQPAFDSLPMTTSGFDNYLAPQMPAPIQIPQQFPFVAQPRPQSAVPQMGTGSAATTRLGSADTVATEPVHSSTPQRPADTSADGGTYTCTYHGCTLRFDTPALLQKHKREGHRQAHGLSAARRPDGSRMPAGLLNTQAGPHRCDRINPSTGKPCNTVFSRPYDLTRHEDTIHNARKQKVRCNLCNEEKTFSRADALTRHYRVCHPDVEFPGKQRRRGGQTG